MKGPKVKKEGHLGWLIIKRLHNFKPALLFWFVHFHPLKSMKICNLAFMAFVLSKGQKACKNCTEGHLLLGYWVSLDKCLKWNLNTFISRDLSMYSEFIRMDQITVIWNMVKITT